MKNLHKISYPLPDEIISQIWAIRNKTQMYKKYIYTIVNMSKYTSMPVLNAPNVISPITISAYENMSGSYVWWWEPWRLKEWNNAGRPPIDMSTVTVI